MAQQESMDTSEAQLKIVPDLRKPQEFHAFVAYAKEDADWVKKNIVQPLRGMNFKILLAEESFVAGQSVINNIEEALNKSRRLIVVCSQNFVQSQWAQYEATQGLQKQLSTGEQYVLVVKYNIEHRNVPKYLNWLTYIDADSNNFKNKLTWSVSGETATMTSQLHYTLEPPGIGRGMAWSYFYSYLNVILPGLKKNIEEYKKRPENAKIKMAEKLYLLVPENANCPTSILAVDDRIKIRNKETDRFSQTVERGGSTRPYMNTVYTIDDKGQTYQALVEYATVLLPLWEMFTSELDMVKMSEEQLVLEVQNFYTELTAILRHPLYYQLGQLVELIHVGDDSPAVSQLVLQHITRSLTTQ